MSSIKATPRHSCRAARGLEAMRNATQIDPFDTFLP